MSFDIVVTHEMIRAGAETDPQSPTAIVDIYRAMRRLAPTTQIVTPDYVGPERRRRFMAPR